LAAFLTGLTCLVLTESSLVSINGILIILVVVLMGFVLRVGGREFQKHFQIEHLEILSYTASIVMKSGKVHHYSGPDAISILHNLSDGTYAIDLKGSAHFYIHELDSDNPSAFSSFISGRDTLTSVVAPHRPMDAAYSEVPCDGTSHPEPRDGRAEQTLSRQEQPRAGRLLEICRIMLTMVIFACPGIAVGVYELSNRVFGTREAALPYFVGVGFGIPAAFLLRLWLQSSSSRKRGQSIR